MNINSTAANNVSALAQQLFKSVDADKDGKLNSNEFQSFLENLVGAMSSKTSGLGSGTGANGLKALDEGTVAATPRTYQGMLGFDYGKLNDPSHTTPKYVFARATQDIDFASDRASRSANLQKIADYAKEHGYPNTTVIGDDTMDFGDGYGEIDVLTSGGEWWWGPKS